MDFVMRHSKPTDLPFDINLHPMSQEDILTFHPALQEVIDAYKQKHIQHQEQAMGTSLKSAINSIHRMYRERLADLEAENRMDAADERLSTIYHEITQHLNHLKKLESDERKGYEEAFERLKRKAHIVFD